MKEQRNLAAAHDGRQQFQERLNNWINELYAFHMREWNNNFFSSASLVIGSVWYFLTDDERAELNSFMVQAKEFLRSSRVWDSNIKENKLADLRVQFFLALNNALHAHKLLLPQWDVDDGEFDVDDALRGAGL